MTLLLGVVSLYHGSNGPTWKVGVVRIIYQGTAYKVCSSGFTNQHAKEMCTNLNYTYGVALPSGGFGEISHQEMGVYGGKRNFRVYSTGL